MTDDYLFILDEDHRPVVCPDVHKWAEWMGEQRRFIAVTEGKGKWVKTIFLGLDDGLLGEPRFFETAYKDAKGIHIVDTTPDYESALALHAQVCKQVGLNEEGGQ